MNGAEPGEKHAKLHGGMPFAQNCDGGFSKDAAQSNCPDGHTLILKRSLLARAAMRHKETTHKLTE
jgi:hypothetical protein